MKKKWIKIWPYGQSKPTSPPFNDLCVIVHIFTGRFCVFWHEHIEISECWHFYFGNKEQKIKILCLFVPLDRRIMITVLKCIVQTPANSPVLFLREFQVNETYAPSDSLSTVCVYEVIEIYILCQVKTTKLSISIHQEVKKLSHQWISKNQS